MARMSVTGDEELGFALTSMQTGLLSESFLSGQPWVNLEQVVVHFGETQIFENQVRSGLNALMTRHDALQLKVTRDSVGRLRQIKETPDTVPLEAEDWGKAAQETRSEQLEAFLEQDRLKGFDLSAPVLWRAKLIQWEETQSVLILTIHHAMTDGRSMVRLTQELLHFLQTGALPPSPGSTRAFEDYCREITQAAPNEDEAEAYFGNYLKDAEDAGGLTLPQQSKGDAQGKRHRQIRKRLPPEAGDRLRHLAAQNDATLANLMQAAWGILLARWQGKQDVMFGVVRSGRHALPDCLQTVGCLINTLPARVTLDHKLTVSDVLTALRQHTLSLHRLEQTTADHIRRSAGLHGDQPLFETAVMFENAGIEPLVTSGLETEWADKIELREEGGMPLMLSVYAENAIEILFEHDEAIVSDQTASRMFTICCGC